MSDQPIELTRAMTLVLIVLCKGAGHGYAIMREIERMTDGDYAVKAGTLYRSISQLMGHSFIEETPAPSYPIIREDERRTYYRITNPGRQAITDELQRLERLLRSARP